MELGRGQPKAPLGHLTCDSHEVLLPRRANEHRGGHPVVNGGEQRLSSSAAPKWRRGAASLRDLKTFNAQVELLRTGARIVLSLRISVHL